jgi:hypothetical protein
VTLELAVTARVSNARLVQLTNPDNPQATTVDAARLSAAATDAQADMLRESGRTYDDTNAVHVSMGVLGVICRLKVIMGEPAAFDSAECSAWNTALAALKSGRIAPVTDSMLTPSTEQSGARPDADRATFDDAVPRAVPNDPRIFILP